MVIKNKIDRRGSYKKQKRWPTPTHIHTSSSPHKPPLLHTHKPHPCRCVMRVMVLYSWCMVLMVWTQWLWRVKMGTPCNCNDCSPLCSTCGGCEVVVWWLCACCVRCVCMLCALCVHAVCSSRHILLCDTMLCSHPTTIPNTHNIPNTSPTPHPQDRQPPEPSGPQQHPPDTPPHCR